MRTLESNGGVISWQIFDALFEHHFDCLRKIRFFIKAGNALKEESVAIEILAEFVKQKEHELQQLRQVALTERDETGCLEVKDNSDNRERHLGPESIRQEDRPVFGKLREICMNGGEEWENLKSLADATHATLKKPRR
jgi:hypothetical protein